MAADFHNLTLDKGATFDPEFTLFEPDETTATDLSGHQAKFRIIGNDGETIYEATKPCTAEGHLPVDISDEVTSTFKPNKVDYELFLLEPSGKVRRLAFGGLSIRGYN